MKKLTKPLCLIGSTKDDPDIRYISGFYAPDPFICLIHHTTCYLVVSPLEAGRARKTSCADVILMPSELPAVEGNQRSVYHWLLRLLKKIRVKQLDVSEHFPLSAAEKLKAAGIRVQCCQDRRLFPEREKKTAVEIARIKEVQQVARSGICRAEEMLREADILKNRKLRWRGQVLTAELIRAEIEIRLLRQNCSSDHTIVAPGRQSADPHEAGTGPVRASEPLVIDIFPRHKNHGYWGDITRTVVKGTVPDELYNMHRVVLKAQEAALNKIKAGVHCKTIHQTAARYIESAGYETKLKPNPEGFIHSTGHGVGLEIHENPSLGRSADILRSGHVVTVEPGLYYRNIGGVRIEDTVVVEKTGYTYLAKHNKLLHIV